MSTSPLDSKLHGSVPEVKPLIAWLVIKVPVNKIYAALCIVLCAFVFCYALTVIYFWIHEIKPEFSGRSPWSDRECSKLVPHDIPYPGFGTGSSRIQSSTGPSAASGAPHWSSARPGSRWWAVEVTERKGAAWETSKTCFYYTPKKV